MTNITRVPLVMLDASGTPGSNIEFDGRQVKVGKELQVGNENIGDATVTGANYDSTTGNLVIVFSNSYEMKVGGFLTTGNIGLGLPGERGASGEKGIDGTNGRDGSKGSTGEQGASGPRGRQGTVGDTGARGEFGRPGAVGATGPQGEAGKVEVYVMQEDPGAEAGPGALWILPG
jgi:hypothetical protein